MLAHGGAPRRSDFDHWLLGYFCHPLRAAADAAHEPEYRRLLHLDYRAWADPDKNTTARLKLVEEYLAQFSQLRPMSLHGLGIDESGEL
eukprot:gnl/TRDRNA2_/TRDRNA2_77195_c0_seq1.p2 gnl/TRDRNA2_/TRDRNA2_77195_c0~~gnl/TRDRNA2_/TRDRNA2_77195_c0_seq1.p2  ORF type:complete len:100 (-),score=13.47 gnl/TRDRNA2_/TRDRNA2_77195_c0_seq1:74-340(-)